MPTCSARIRVFNWSFMPRLHHAKGFSGFSGNLRIENFIDPSGSTCLVSKTRQKSRRIHCNSYPNSVSWISLKFVGFRWFVMVCCRNRSCSLRIKIPAHVRWQLFLDMAKRPGQNQARHFIIHNQRSKMFANVCATSCAEKTLHLVIAIHSCSKQV